MKRHFFYALLVLVFACRGKVGPKPDRYSYQLSGKEKLVVTDLSKKVSDTIDIDLYDEEPDRLYVEDLSDSLRFESLLLQVNFTGRSDQEYSQFYEFRDGSLKLLFDIANLTKIERLDENRLEGFTRDRDEVTNSFQDDYPFYVLLKEDTVRHMALEVQYIGYETEALSTINAYRINGMDTLPFIIKEGTPIKVDTFYRWEGRVKLLVNDSIPVYIGEDSLTNKIRQDGSG